MNTDYITLVIYLILLLTLGAYFARFNRNLSDFIRGGAQGTWWIVGMSMFISGISAFTYTGAASAAFQAGWSLFAMYFANVASFVVSGLFLAKWFRQTRALTVADIIRDRFGVAMEQFNAYAGVVMNPISGGIQLWALAGFASSTFGFPLKTTIIVIGAIVVLYSTTGGKWAVMATDFVQGLIMMTITVVVAILALNYIGGFGAFGFYFSDPRFANDYKFFNDFGQFPGDKFTWYWMIVIFFISFQQQISIGHAYRFLVVKDGREAQTASWLAGGLMVFGILLWFIPPMVGRFMFESEILGLAGATPSDGAYAYVALKILPKGLVGIMIAAMFAATMSSMDTSLNGQVGIIVRNIIPRIRQRLGKEPLRQATEMRLCRLLTVLLGCLLITYSLLWILQKDVVMFDAYLTISSVIGIPLGLPMLVGLYLKRLWKWSYFLIIGACLLPSAYALYDSNVNDAVWTIQDRAVWIFIFGFATSALCVWLSKRNDAQYVKQEAEFFETMARPVDFEAEIGADLDGRQLIVMGNAGLMLGSLLSLLVLVPNDLPGRLWCAAVAGTILVIGYVLKRKGVSVERVRTTSET